VIRREKPNGKSVSCDSRQSRAELRRGWSTDRKDDNEHGDVRDPEVRVRRPVERWRAAYRQDDGGRCKTAVIYLPLL
jgi:hypothetical protein